jgi:hypothetical protein
VNAIDKLVEDFCDEDGDDPDRWMGRVPPQIVGRRMKRAEERRVKRDRGLRLVRQRDVRLKREWAMRRAERDCDARIDGEERNLKREEERRAAEWRREHVLRDTVFAVLRRWPDDWDLQNEAEVKEVRDRILIQRRWPRDLPAIGDRPALTHLHHALHQLVEALAGTRDTREWIMSTVLDDVVADIRRALETGVLKTFLVNGDGDHFEIPATRWQGEGNQALWWRGEGAVKLENDQGERGIVYLDASTVATMLRSPAPASAEDPDDLGENERNTYRKMILGMALEKYRHKPGMRDSAVANIAGDLEERGLKVHRDTIRQKLQDAEQVYDQNADRKLNPT